MATNVDALEHDVCLPLIVFWVTTIKMKIVPIRPIERNCFYYRRKRDLTKHHIFISDCKTNYKLHVTQTFANKRNFNRPQSKLSGYSFETGNNLEVLKKTFCFSNCPNKLHRLQLLLNVLMETNATCIQRIVQL